MEHMLEAGAPKRIILFRALFLGDFLCSVPAINAIKRHFPDVEITLVGLPWARELAARFPAIDHFEVFPGHPELIDQPVDEARVPEFYDRVRSARYDLAVQLHGSGAVANEIVAGFGAALTLGYGAEGDRWLTTALPWREDEHEIRRWLRLVSVLGVETSDTRVAFPVANAERARAGRLLRDLPARGPIVGLHAGAKDPARRWPADRFVELGDALASRYGARIVLTGSGAERPLTNEIGARMRFPSLDLAGRTADLGDFAALIAQLDLLVTNDTGASHIAAAVGAPSVVLFGPSRPVRWAPLDSGRHTAIDAREIVGNQADLRDLLSRLPVAPVLAVCERKLNEAMGGSEDRRAERALAREIA